MNIFNILSFWFISYFLIAFAAAAATVLIKRCFLNNIEQFKIIFKLFSVSSVKRSFYFINDIIIDWNMDTLLKKQRDAISAKKIWNLDCKVFKAVRIKKGDFSPQKKRSSTRRVLERIKNARIPDLSMLSRHIAKNSLIAYKLDILKQLKGSKFVIKHRCVKPQLVKARVTVLN